MKSLEGALALAPRPRAVITRWHSRIAVSGIEQGRGASRGSWRGGAPAGRSAAGRSVRVFSERRRARDARARRRWTRAQWARGRDGSPPRRSSWRRATHSPSEPGHGALSCRATRRARSNIRELLCGCLPGVGAGPFRDRRDHGSRAGGSRSNRGLQCRRQPRPAMHRSAVQSCQRAAACVAALRSLAALRARCCAGPGVSQASFGFAMAFVRLGATGGPSCASKRDEASRSTLASRMRSRACWRPRRTIACATARGHLAHEPLAEGAALAAQWPRRWRWRWPRRAGSTRPSDGSPRR